MISIVNNSSTTRPGSRSWSFEITLNPILKKQVLNWKWRQSENVWTSMPINDDNNKTKMLKRPGRKDKDRGDCSWMSAVGGSGGRWSTVETSFDSRLFIYACFIDDCGLFYFFIFFLYLRSRGVLCGTEGSSTLEQPAVKSPTTHFSFHSTQTWSCNSWFENVFGGK